MNAIRWLLLLLLLVFLYFGFLRARAARAPGGGRGPGGGSGPGVGPAGDGGPGSTMRGGDPSNNVGINNVSLRITPASNPCDGISRFTWTVDASGWSVDGVSRNVNIDIYDDELRPDHPDHVPDGAATIPTVIGAAPTPPGTLYPLDAVVYAGIPVLPLLL